MADPAPISFPDTTGISEDDRKDIFDQIERVAQQNRLQAGPEVFELHPNKRGFLVPLAVNICAFVVLLAGLATLWLLYRQNAQNLVENQVVLQSAEGKLLEELKKSSESELLAKDQQIADIQKKVQVLNQQKEDLQITMDSKIAAKEAELKAELQQALEAERVRLTQAGYTKAVVEEKLRAFEKQKNAEFQRELAAFKKKAESERQALETNLKKQQAEFQQNLGDLAAERQQILEDSKKKQSQLQAELDQKNHELETQQSVSRAELAQAQQQLQDLNEQRTKTESVQNQLFGLYTKISQAIESRQFPLALQRVQGLVTFLDDSSVRFLPEIKKRRQADLYLASTLSDWLTQDQKRLDADKARLQTTQSSIETLQTLVRQAEEALVAGKNSIAEDLYDKALSQVPSVLEAHQYFVNKALKAERTRQEAISEALATGDDALMVGKLDDAVSAYQDALNELPLSSDEKKAFLGHWTQAAFDSELQKRQSLSDQTMQKELSDADALVNDKKTSQALAAYVAILSKYPLGKVGSASLSGIRRIETQLDIPSSRELALNAELTKTQAELAQVKERLSSESTITGKGSNPKALPESQDLIVQLKSQAKNLQAMKAEFQNFVAKDASLWTKSPSSSQVLQSRMLLDGFLAAPEVNASFPGLDVKIGRYEKLYLEAGQKESLQNADDALQSLAQLGSAEERRQYLAELKRHFADNKQMIEFLSNLSTLF